MSNPTSPEFTYPEPLSFLVEENVRFKGAHGGRSSAKSGSFARACLDRGIERPLTILCAREYQASIKDSVKSMLDDLIEKCGCQDHYTSYQNEIRGKNGTLIIFSGLARNIESIKSKYDIDICWVEEANSLSQDSLDTLVPTIRAEGSEVWFSYNRKLEDEPVHKFLQEQQEAGRAILKHINYDQNPFLTQTEKDDIAWFKKHRPDDFGHVYLGQPKTVTEAVVFKGKYVIEEFEPKNDEIFDYGADWGFARDPSTLIRLYVREEEKRIYIDHEAYAVGIETDHLPDLFSPVPGSKDWPIIADNARPETISYMKRHGFPRMQPCKKGPGSVEAGIDWLRGFTLVIHPRCKHTIDEVMTYSYKVDKAGNVTPVLEDKKNHIIDPLRYATEKHRKKRSKVVAA